MPLVGRLSFKPEAFKRLRTIADALKFDDGDKRGPVLRLVDSVCRRQFQRAYTTEGASTSGGPWARLSPGYAAWKKRRFPGRKILVRTRETRERFIRAKHPLHIAEFVPQFSFRIGAVSSVQAAHESGIGSPGQKLPIRALTGKTAKDREEFQSALVALYIKRIRQVLRHART